jgi:hypothetical protein
MDTIIIDTNTVNLQSRKSPSLLRQIVDRVDEMDEGAKKLLLLTLTGEELSEKYKAMDKAIAQSEVLTEDEIDKIVAETRQNIYEQKVRP